MLFKVAMIILLIVIIFLVIKYLYVQAKILSSREFRKTAEKKSAVMQVYDPQITCDYCGYIINTAKDSKCPNCGAVLNINRTAKCEYCGSIVTVDSYDWAVNGIKGISQRTSG